MQRFAALLFLLALVPLLFSANSTTVEGGNISCAISENAQSTLVWGGVVGWINTSSTPSDPHIPIGFVNITNATIYTIYLNSTYLGDTVIFTRLNHRPLSQYLYTPTASDFNESGMFSNFSVFSGMNFSNVSDSPSNTFCNPCANTICRLAGLNLSCPYVILKNNTVMGVLKFSNGTHTEPIFVTVLESKRGFNGTFFDFEYMLPVNESYYAFTYDTVPPNVTIISPIATAYTTVPIPFQFNITDNYMVDSCWYTLDTVTVLLPNCNTSYLLTVTVGTHSLTLYANDSEGNVGSDSVVFSVSTKKWGSSVFYGAVSGRGNMTPTSETPQINFIITLEDPILVNNYPANGLAKFILSSNVELKDISCAFRWDMENVSKVRLNRSVINPMQNASGTILLMTTPEIALTHGGTYEGTLECTAAYGTLNVSSSAKIDIIVRRPKLDVKNESITAYVNRTKDVQIRISNTGNANAVNVSVRFKGPYAEWLSQKGVQKFIEMGGKGIANFDLNVPEGMYGVYKIPYEVYEFDHLMSSGIIVVNVIKTEEVTTPPEVAEETYVCCLPAIIIALGLVATIIMFIKKLPSSIKEKRYFAPLLYATAILLLFLAIAIVVIVLQKEIK